jgi:hypothetical protein
LEPCKPDLSINIKSLGLLILLLFTFYPIGYFRTKAIIKQADLLHEKYARGLIITWTIPVYCRARRVRAYPRA